MTAHETLDYLKYVSYIPAGLGFFAMIWLLYAYTYDRLQRKQAVRRNYPLIGRGRYVMEHLGTFFRQYFFAQDREEMPFNRAQRSWVYRAAKNQENVVPFGSTNELIQPGSISIMHAPFPLNPGEGEPVNIEFGQGYADKPYKTDSFFHISGMSFGALSQAAVEALSRGAKKAGIWMNTGEGSLSKFHIEGGADIIFQIGTAKFGIGVDGKMDDKKLEALAKREQVKMFEIKLSQGAKPGAGGILLGKKVTEEIAATRHVEPGKDVISPARHADINNTQELLDMIQRVRKISGKPCGIKFAVGDTTWCDELFTAIKTRGLDSAPDFIVVDSSDGGTGAAPQSFIDSMGMVNRQSLPLVVDKLNEYGFKDRIRIGCSGKLIKPTEVAWALAVGADFVTSARGFMFSLGCIQALSCHNNKCPTGITTQDKSLQKGLDVADKSERVANYATNIRKEVTKISYACGVVNPLHLQRKHIYITNEKSVPVSFILEHPDIQKKAS